MSDSSSSCEENIEQLREAVNNEFISDALYNKKGKIHNSAVGGNDEKLKKCPSIRAQLEKERDCHPLNVTPEFQNFVAKHLSRILDRKLEDMCEDFAGSQHVQEEQHCHSGGVRLFSCSTDYISEASDNSRKSHRKKKIADVDKDDSGEELEKCVSASVSPDWVLSKKGIEGWEKLSKGEIVVVNNKGNVVNHLNAKTKIRTNSCGIKEREFNIH